MRNIGRLLLRLTIGGLFVGHGTQKLFGWFGGHGLEKTAGFFEMLGLRPGKRHALAAGLAETGGGAALIVGATPPLASAVLIATMITAIQRAHLSKGPWVTNGGYEYNLVLIAALLALSESGPGKPALNSDMYGPRWAWTALALGAAGAAGAHIVAEAANEPEPAPAAAPEAAAAETQAEVSVGV
jgi:putative oxidoreductase